MWLSNKYEDRPVKSKKFNQELQEELKMVIINEFIKRQRIQCLGYTYMWRCVDIAIRSNMDWKPDEKRPGGSPLEKVDRFCRKRFEKPRKSRQVE